MLRTPSTVYVYISDGEATLDDGPFKMACHVDSRAADVIKCRNGKSVCFRSRFSAFEHALSCGLCFTTKYFFSEKISLVKF